MYFFSFDYQCPAPSGYGAEGVFLCSFAGHYRPLAWSFRSLCRAKLHGAAVTLFRVATGSLVGPRFDVASNDEYVRSYLIASLKTSCTPAFCSGCYSGRAMRCSFCN